MPIRDVVIFPFMMTPFVVGRESSVRALEEALAADKKIFLATQHDASIDEPKSNEIYQVGTIVNIVQSLKLPMATLKFWSKALSAAGFCRPLIPMVTCRPRYGSLAIPSR